MKNSIPDQYVFSCELFRSVERSAVASYGVSSPDTVEAVIVRKMARESNTILCDLYQQILERMRRPHVMR
jgi:hypothetical protein